MLKTFEKIWPQIGRLGLLLGLTGVITLGCSWFSSEVVHEIDPLILSELNEALKDAPTDELSETYDPLSLLKKAESFYTEKNYIEAVAEYEFFLELHPLSPWAAFAQYRLALSHFHQIGSVDRDVEPVLRALASFEKLRDLYPDNPFQEPADEKILACRDQLAEREFYVGKFYYKKSSYLAAIARFERILQNYPETQTVSKTLYFLALSFQAQDQGQKAIQQLQILLEKYPEAENHQNASELLSQLDEKT